VITETSFGTGIAFTGGMVPTIREEGFFVTPRPCGFVVHFTASGERLHRLRRLTSDFLRALGAADAADSVALAESELVGNAVRAAGPFAPLVAEVSMTSVGVELAVHDPLRHQLPQSSEDPEDEDLAESGRGLAIVRAVASDWTVALTTFDKAVCCLIPVTPA
jgi:anti-sigma regulatory factor (Ser/Thr protein kinase)